jgi:hypothetical protein
MKKSILFFLLVSAHLLCHAQGGIWTWVKGSSAINDPGNIGTIGVTNIANYPPGRYQAAQWTDLNGNFWIFGGVDNISTVFYHRNDLWKYDPTYNTWTYVNGPLTGNAAGVYGTQGIPGHNNIPGGRAWGTHSWTDQQGRLWLHEGLGYDRNDNYGLLDDLWMYDIATNQWTWMAGSDLANPMPQYGTLQVAGAGNTQGGRSESNTAWVKSDGTLWTFGGQSNTHYDGFNDVWKFDISTNMWAWMSGDSSGNIAGNYGNLNAETATNRPPARMTYTHWQDAEDNFYIFAGATNSGSYRFNDVWKYNTVNNQWTWIGGDTTTNDTGLYVRTCSPGNNIGPDGRFENRSAQFNGCSNIFWTFGGMGTYLYNNDLWKFNTQTGQWTWVSGDSIGNGTGSYGNIGVPSMTNLPPPRFGACMWVDSSGVIWIWGGWVNGFDSYSDMWKFVPDTACVHLSQITSNINKSICQGDSFVIGGVVHRTSGYYSKTLTASNGCDSIVNLNLTVDSLPLVTWTQKNLVTPCGHSTLLNSVTPSGGYFSGSFVRGDSIIDPPSDTTFTVMYYYIDSGCTGSASLQFTSTICTGITGPAGASPIRLYPNPNNGSFILDAPQAIGSTYTIYDMLGRLIQQGIINAESTPISMSGSADGVYALVVHTAASSGTIRFTVLK